MKIGTATFLLFFSVLCNAQVESLEDYLEDHYKVLGTISNNSYFGYDNNYGIDTNWNPIQEIIEVGHKKLNEGEFTDSTLCYHYFLNEKGYITEKRFDFKKNGEEYSYVIYVYSEAGIDTTFSPFYGAVLSPNGFFDTDVYSNCVQRDSCGLIQSIVVSFNNGKVEERLGFYYSQECEIHNNSWLGLLLVRVEYYLGNELKRVNKIKYITRANDR